MNPLRASRILHGNHPLASPRPPPWRVAGGSQWVIPVKNPGSPQRLHDTPNSHAQISPDGKWVAFNAMGQIYVKPFPTGDGSWRVSTEGGAFARWRGDSKELYYLSRATFGQMMAVEMTVTGTALQPGKPRALFETGYANLNHPSNYHTFSVAADGQRFLIPRLAPNTLTVFDPGGRVVRTLDRGVGLSLPSGCPTAPASLSSKSCERFGWWTRDTGKATRLTTNQPEDLVTGLVWSADGRQVAYNVRKIDRELIYRIATDGTGTEELVFRLPGFGLSLTDWAPDGRLIHDSSQLAGNRLFALPVTADPKPIEIDALPTFPILGARISPTAGSWRTNWPTHPSR